MIINFERDGSVTIRPGDVEDERTLLEWQAASLDPKSSAVMSFHNPHFCIRHNSTVELSAAPAH